MEGLLDEFGAALADLSEDFAAQKISADGMVASLARIVDTLESRKTLPIDDLVMAFKELRITAPAVTVNVSPTPIEILAPQPLVQILERPMPYAYRIHDITKDRHGEITGALISPVLPVLQS